MKPQIFMESYRANKLYPCPSVQICGFINIILPDCLTEYGKRITETVSINRRENFLNRFEQVFGRHGRRGFEFF
jgi:hypothetical protein